jgi:magnesium chelatase family protein
VAARVAAARRRAVGRGVPANGRLPAGRLDEVAPLDAGAARLLERALGSGRLSGRGLGGVRRVALTVADLAGGSDRLTAEHVATALALRADPSGLAGQVA